MGGILEGLSGTGDRGELVCPSFYRIDHLVPLSHNILMTNTNRTDLLHPRLLPATRKDPGYGLPGRGVQLECRLVSPLPQTTPVDRFESEIHAETFGPGLACRPMGNYTTSSIEDRPFLKSVSLRLVSTGRDKIDNTDESAVGWMISVRTRPIWRLSRPGSLRIMERRAIGLGTSESLLVFFTFCIYL